MPTRVSRKEKMRVGALDFFNNNLSECLNLPVNSIRKMEKCLWVAFGLQEAENIAKKLIKTTQVGLKCLACEQICIEEDFILRQTHRFISILDITEYNTITSGNNTYII